MSRRNFTLLILVLAIVVALVFGFLYSRRSGPSDVGDGAGGGFFSQFNPFGGGGSGPSGGGETPPEVVDISGFEPEPGQAIGRMRMISSLPVAGFGAFQKERYKEMDATPLDPSPAEKESSTSLDDTTPPNPPLSGRGTPTPPEREFAPAVRYVDRATGNIYQTFLDQIQERRFTDTLIPKVYEALFGDGSQSVVMRYLGARGDNIETFLGTLPLEPLGADTAEENEVVGSFLPENTRDISVSPDGSKMFYLFDSGDGTVGMTLDFSTGKKVQVFDSPFTEWLSSWPNSRLITLTTKPSWSVPGYMYALDPTRKTFSKVLGGINGLTTLAGPDGKLVLYANNSLSLYIYDTETRDSAVLGLRTLPEKCIWSTSSVNIYCAVPRVLGGGLYPDNWYRGEVTFGDQFWKIDVDSGNTTLVLDPTTEVGREVDGTKLALDESEKYLVFVDKKDSILWEIELE